MGTYLGGWRIIRTLGKRIYDIETPQGFGAESSTTAVILVSSHLGFPLSTTQVATGSIFGAGAGKKLVEVRWGMAGRMVIAWALTLPAAAVIGALAASISSTGTLGTVIVALVGIAFAVGLYAASRRKPVTAHNVNELPKQHSLGNSRQPARRRQEQAMNINWAAFGTVFVASFGAAVAVIALFSLGVANLAPITRDDDTTTRPTRSAQAVAGLCFLACAVIVAYGLYTIVRQ